MRSILAGLEEVRDALSRETRRGAIVLCAIVAALWLCVAGGVSAATRTPPLTETVLACKPPAPEPITAAPGPIEWPTIAMSHRPEPFKKKSKHIKK